MDPGGGPGWTAPICDVHWSAVESATADPDHARLWLEDGALYIETI